VVHLLEEKEDKIQSYEEKRYHNASFGAVIEVSDALGVKLQHCTVMSEISDFLGKELAKIRQPQHIDADLQQSNTAVLSSYPSSAA
jgi:hypothetical protein